MRTKLILSLAAALCLGGCSMAPKLETPQVALPQSASKASAIDAQWWKGFGDARLEALIEEALAQSDDLKLSMANVSRAKAALRLSGADRYPTITAAASAYRQRLSGESLSPFQGFIYNSFGLSASVSYELDFWGKYQNAESAAWAELMASEADKEALRLSLIAGVAELYIKQTALSQKIALLEATREAYREGYEYRLREFRHGLIDEAVAAQAEALYADAGVQLLALQAQQMLTQSALALALGRDPKALFEQGIDAAQALPKALQIEQGLPSSLLERRPDIRAALERLHASNALIGVAKADYFPSLTLTGSFGDQSLELDKLMTGAAQTWGFGPSLSLPMLDFGRVDSNVDRAEAQQEMAKIEYVKSVKGAFKEVYDALEGIKHVQAQIEAQSAQIAALKCAETLTQKRYERGYADYLSVLDTKRSLLGAEASAVDLDAALLTQQIALYKALGGGWSAKAD
ncbi:MAG: efflux transporter outer membrane subunit [Campylobacterales bacterium]|nr:efflux transporter outer membrane subunit [Campylobacterales bacterium]